MKIASGTTQFKGQQNNSLLGLLIVLALVLLALFFRGVQPDHVVFSNDGPLGQQQSAYLQPTSVFTGVWSDLNWVGTSWGYFSFGITSVFRAMVGPLYYSKFLAPLSLFLVGICAWFFFRQLGFSKSASIIGGLAAATNGDFVATACWGVAGQPVCFAMCYLAMALVANLDNRPWVRTALAGIAVGIGVIEASDIGAIFSIFVAAWVAFHALVQEGSMGQRILRGGLRLALVAGCAAFIASSALTSLISTQIKGVVGMAQDEQTKAQRWGEATQWSLPKREIVDLFVPGFFGFRMDTPHDLPDSMQRSHGGGAYWGFGGRDAAWDSYLRTDKHGPVPPGFIRYGMGSGYAGILVLLMAAWAVAQSFRGQNSFYPTAQRRMIWFWLGILVVSAAFMFGRFAPFYRFLYALPYASTFRNPAKFLHVFEWALIVISAYGLHGVTTLYFERAAATTRGVGEQFTLWWRQAKGFDKRWVVATLVAFALACVAWFCLAGLRGKVEGYIAELNQLGAMQQGGKPDVLQAAEAATATMDFSLRQVRWAVGALAVSVGLLALVVSGAFAGKRARVAAVLLGVLVVVDLGWQARPWVIAQNWHRRYVDAAENPAFDFLRQHPFAQRVSDIPDELTRAFGRQLDPRLLEMEGFFQSVYGSEWSQQLFPYYNIQSINIIQMPRPPVDYPPFEETLRFWYNTNSLHSIPRKWELTSTRYIVGTAALMQVLDQGFDAGRRRFQPRLLFKFVANPAGGNYPLISTNTTGPYGIFEFTGALPKAKLYSNWEVPVFGDQTKAWTNALHAVLPPGYPLALDSVATNDLATLELLDRPSFDPAKTVLLAEPLATAPATNETAGSVEFVSYQPKDILLKTRSAGASVLLLNDRYDPTWRVTVDGQPAKLLRCNYLMRGVQVPAGEHQVEFQFRPDLTFQYVSVAAIGVAVVLILTLVVSSRKPAAPVEN